MKAFWELDKDEDEDQEMWTKRKERKGKGASYVVGMFNIRFPRSLFAACQRLDLIPKPLIL